MRNLIYITLAMTVGVFAYGIYESRFDDRIQTDKVTIERRTAASGLNSEGTRLLESGELDQALVKLREAREEDPENIVIAHNLSLAISRLGQRYSDDGDTEGSHKYQEEAISLWPDNPEALERLAMIQYRAGSYGKARNYVEDLMASQPDRMDLKTLLAHLDKVIAENEGMVTEQGRNFRLLYSGERKLEFEGELMSVLQEQMDNLTALLGVFPRDPIEVLIMTEELGDRGSSPDPYLTGIYDGRIRLYPGKELYDTRVLIDTVRHEMIHALLHRAGGRIPAWFHEGVAQRLGEEYTFEEMAQVRLYVRGLVDDNWFRSLGDLDETFIEMHHEDRVKAYAVSLLFVDFLLKKYGETLIPVVISELQSGHYFSVAITNAVGKRIILLQDEFLASLGYRG
ncbi:MAG: tetratricopeptide repeat protein [bacterium]